MSGRNSRVCCGPACSGSDPGRTAITKGALVLNILFSNVTAVTMDDARPVLNHAFVTVSGDAITYVGETRPAGAFHREIDGAGKVLMPGLVNSHTHIPMTLMRGYGGGCDLQTWLNDYIFPAEGKLDSRAVRAGTALALMELIASGCTCLNDMYYFCDDIVAEVLNAGLSANLSRSVTCFEPVEQAADFPSCREMRGVVERWNGYGSGQIMVDASIHGEYTSFLAPAIWTYLGEYAKEQGIGMHIHVSETRSEHEACIARHGKTPMQTLNDYGVWDVRAVAAHCVWCTPEDLALMAEKGISVAHNPVSNLKLGSGVADVPAMLKAGINVTLATDGVSSNNSHDLFEEIKTAAILHKGVSHDPMVITPWESLKMATANGAKALGRNTGMIQEGKTADLILLDFDRPHLLPCHDVVENLVFSARGSDVVMNMARGRVIYENGVFVTLDAEKVKAEVTQYALPKLFG